VDLVLTSGGDSAQKLLDGRSLENLCEEALIRTMHFLQQTLGKNRKKWIWGLLHKYHFGHPGGKGPLASWLLNRGPYPAPGNGSTVNLSLYNPGHRGEAHLRYTVNTIPSLRMVADLSHPDRTYVVGPMGQSGQPGSPHYADMIDPWRKGELVPLPLSRDTVDKIAVHTLELCP
jgi:acyl-homoserine-lactone acylase